MNSYSYRVPSKKRTRRIFRKKESSECISNNGQCEKLSNISFDKETDEFKKRVWLFGLIQKLVKLLCPNGEMKVKLNTLEKTLNSIISSNANTRKDILDLANVAPSLIKVDSPIKGYQNLFKFNTNETTEIEDFYITIKHPEFKTSLVDLEKR